MKLNCWPEFKNKIEFSEKLLKMQFINIFKIKEKNHAIYFQFECQKHSITSYMLS